MPSPRTADLRPIQDEDGLDRHSGSRARLTNAELTRLSHPQPLTKVGARMDSPVGCEQCNSAKAYPTRRLVANPLLRTPATPPVHPNRRLLEKYQLRVHASTVADSRIPTGALSPFTATGLPITHPLGHMSFLAFEDPR